jgi:two-component system cell cycle sensor histidine kinase/response regulator CckA
MRPLPFLLLLTLAVSLPAAVPAPASAPALRIGVESADNPISFLDAAGKPTGFSAALIAEMGRAELGEFELVPDRWTAVLRRFNAGELDALANVARTEERLLTMDFSITHAFVHGIIYYRPNRAPLRTTADFNGKIIGTLKGSLAHKNALEHAGWGATIRPFESPQAAIDATVRGECDGVLLIYGSEGKHVNDPRGLKRGFVDDILHEFRFAVRKGDHATLARLNDALATVRANGTFDRLYDKWIGPIEPHPIRLADLRPYAVPLALGGFFIVAIIFWQRRMFTRASRQARALQESEERFHRLVDSAFEGWVIQRDGLILLANPSFAQTFGFTQAELIGKSVLDLTAPESRARLSEAIQTGSTTSYEVFGQRKDGSFIPVQIAGQPCTYLGQPARIAAVRDLTAQKQTAADQLVLSKLESTGILAGGIAHDFNNLFATLVLNVDLALLENPASPEVVGYLTPAKHTALSARTLTPQLITFARGGTFARQPTYFAALLQKVSPLTLVASNVRAELFLAPDLWVADVDAGQVERVLLNLILNAREAMPAGGIVSVRAANLTVHDGEIPPLSPGEYLRIDVADLGTGIAADTLPKIFDPYFSTKQRGSQKGMGLGLTISHSIIQQHGGTLTVDSVANVGTTFHIYLPATRASVAAIPPAAPALHPRRGRILVMDDETSLRDMVRAALVRLDYTADTADSGQTALALYRTALIEGRPFDAVLLDLTVRGGMGGLETLAALRALDPNVTAIVMSGYANEPALRDYARHGFRAALAKPFELEQLETALTRVLVPSP